MTSITQERTRNHVSEDEVFLLPASGFYSDHATGAAHVALPDDFYALDPERQLAILAGWRRGVDESWMRSLVGSFRRLYGDDETLPLPERLETFRRDFAERGIEIPADFALALQRY